MTEEATLRALVHGKQTAISFRHLSSLLSVSTRRAQVILRQFAESDRTVTTLWCVTQPHPKTGVIRTSLTTTPPDGCKKQIWAVGPPSTAKPVSEHALWLAPDAARDRNLVAEPSHVQNELRDGRWNRVKCQTATWDSKLDPRLGGDQRLACGLLMNPSSTKTNSSSLLASVKARTKGKRTKAKGFMNGAYKPSSGTSNSLFASKPLGANAVKKMRSFSSAEGKENGKESNSQKPKSESLANKEKQQATGRKAETKKKPRKRTPSKQSRKIQDDDTDNEAHPSLEEEEPEEDDQEECLRKFEREEAEKEKADAERSELEKELMELHRQDADEDPESPEFGELEENGSENHKAVSPAPRSEEHEGSPGSGKRSFWRTFGDSPDRGKRIRREVEETVEENGYFVTRRIVKTFDEHGNEVKDLPVEKVSPEPEGKPNAPDSENKMAIPAHPKTPSSTDDKFSKPSLTTDKARDSKRTISKLETVTKKTPKKKKKGSIMSYFGKKV